MSYVVPSVTDFKSFFVRDFPYTNDATDLTKVQDSDISKAIDEAGPLVNDELFDSQGDFTRAYLYLSAHFLCTDLQNSSQGVSGAFSWATNSRSVGSVSQSFTIPEIMQKNPLWLMMSQTAYGARYLMMIQGRLAGAMGVAYGRTLP